MSEAAVAEAVTPAAPAAGERSDILGLVDTIAPGRMYGWAHDAARPGVRLRVELRLGDQLIEATVADQERKDLAANNVGDGFHAFSFALTPELYAAVTELRVLVIGPNDVEIPVAIRLPRQDTHQVLSDAQSNQAQRVIAEHRQLREGIASIGSRIDNLPDAARFNEALDEQAALRDRVTALELWLGRLDSQMATLQQPEAGPPDHRTDPWEAVLFGALALTVVIMVGTAAYLGLR